MYHIEDITHEYRTSPWERPCQDRIEILKRAKKLKKKTVAFLYDQIFASSTFRYRGYNVVETLEYSFQWTGTYFEIKEISQVQGVIHNIDILMIVRCGWDFELGNLIEVARKIGTRIVYDVDDLIYHPKYMPIVIKNLNLKKGEEWDSWFGLTQRNHMIAEVCDAYITTNGYLAEHLEKDYHKTCYVNKNYLNWIQEDISRELFKQKIVQKSQKPFVIGYFSGSPTHVKDLMIAMPEIEQFLNAHNDVKLRIVGYMELPEEYSYLVEAGKIEYVPFQTFIGLQVEQAKVDVNIVPLINNQFSNCKSELKYFENAIVGTITCATPTYTYSQAIVNGDNGYLCDQGEWLPTLEKIYKEGVSIEKQEYLFKKALEQYRGRNQVEHVEKILNSICRGR